MYYNKDLLTADDVKSLETILAKDTGAKYNFSTNVKMRILEEFRKQGFIVEMDDFGSGYSSLNMLKDMPVDVLKIDMNFRPGG